MNIGLSDLDKEAAAERRIAARRAANEQRRGRFQNARERVMGVNVAALDAQVAERKLNMKNEAHMVSVERFRFAEVEKALELAAEEEKEMRAYQAEVLKASWDTSMEEKAARDAVTDPLFNRNVTGMSAAQKFSGEDESRRGRLRAQQEQLSRWTKEKLDEEAHVKEEQRKEVMENDAMMMEIDRLRGVAEDEEKQLRQAMMQQQNRLNADFAALRKEKEAADLIQSQKDDSLACLPIVNERKENALSNNGNVAAGSRDNFKGYTKGQVRRILSDNEELIDYKHAKADEADRAERIWRLQQDISQKEMEKAFMEEQLARAMTENDRLETIKQQMVEEKARQEFSRKDAFGSAGHVFFNKFGTSCR